MFKVLTLIVIPAIYGLVKGWWLSTKAVLPTHRMKVQNLS